MSTSRYGTMSINIKICGITRMEDAESAIDLGVDYIGFVLHKPSKRFSGYDRIAEIAATIGGRCKKVGVFVNTTPTEVRTLVTQLGLDIAQLHGDETPGVDWNDLPFPIWRAVWVTDTGWAPDPDVWPTADRLVIDHRVGDTYGGGGQPANWENAARLSATYPILLAGGLTPENVHHGLAAVNPQGVDVSSGVESAPGIKDASKIRAFVDAVRQATTKNGPQA